MTALITSQPILVATGARDASSQNSDLVGAAAGPHLATGPNRYAPLVDIVTNPPAKLFQVFKSPNGGRVGSWSLKDAIHSPPLATFPNYEVIAAADGIYYVWNGDGQSGGAPSNGIGYSRFDIVTDTWGAVHSAPGNTINPDCDLAIARRSNGDIVVIFRSQAPAAGNLQYGIFARSTGAFSGPFNFNVSSVNLQPRAAIAGPDDTIHVILVDGVSFATGAGDIYYQALSPANAVSAATFIVTLGAGTPDSFLAGLPVASTALNQILFPFSNTSGVPNRTAMFVGTPISAPAWTQHTLETGLPAGVTYGYPIAHIQPDGSVIIFQTINQSGGPPLQLWYTLWSGAALGTPVLFYDAIANPPAAGPVDELLKVSVTQMSPIEALVSMQLTAGTPPENTYFFSSKECLL